MNGIVRVNLLASTSAGPPEAIRGWSGPARCQWWSHQQFAHEVHSKILDLAFFLAVRRHSCSTSASNWKFSHTERKSYACTLSLCTLPDFTTAVQSGHETTQKSSTLVENGPAMAAPARLVPAPMEWLRDSNKPIQGVFLQQSPTAAMHLLSAGKTR